MADAEKPERRQPATLSIEEWLLAQVIEHSRRLIDQGHDYRRLLRFMLAGLLVVWVLVIALMWQVWSRNDDLVNLERSSARIEEIARSFQDDEDTPDEFTERVLDGLEQIDRLCQQVGCEP